MRYITNWGSQTCSNWNRPRRRAGCGNWPDSVRKPSNRFWQPLPLSIINDGNMRNYHRTLMKTLLYFIFILLVTLVAPVNAQTPATKQAESTPTEDVRIIERQNRPISIHKSFGSNQIQDWQVLDDNNMVIEA